MFTNTANLKTEKYLSTPYYFLHAKQNKTKTNSLKRVNSYRLKIARKTTSTLTVGSIIGSVALLL